MVLLAEWWSLANTTTAIDSFLECTAATVDAERQCAVLAWCTLCLYASATMMTTTTINDGGYWVCTVSARVAFYFSLDSFCHFLFTAAVANWHTAAACPFGLRRIVRASIICLCLSARVCVCKSSCIWYPYWFAAFSAAAIVKQYVHTYLLMCLVCFCLSVSRLSPFLYVCFCQSPSLSASPVETTCRRCSAITSTKMASDFTFVTASFRATSVCRA